MKILKEDKLPMKDPRYPQKSGDSVLRAELGNFIHDCLDDALDNIAMIAASQVAGYNADWCEQEGSGPNITALNLAMDHLVKEVTDLLLANKPA